jgi:hypothetical protein
MFADKLSPEAKVQVGFLAVAVVCICSARDIPHPPLEVKYVFPADCIIEKLALIDDGAGVI